MKILTIKEVISMTSLSRSTLYVMINEGSFPKPLKLHERKIGWLPADIEEWISKLQRVEYIA